jgi:abequosyltransferase
MRGSFIQETLESIVPQLDYRCELIIVDGASPDNTEDVVRPFVEKYASVRYVREKTNSGVDRDYDKAVSYAAGDYCWLMTDDDLLVSGAVQRVLAALEVAVDLVIVNSQVRTADFSSELKANLLSRDGCSEFDAGQADELFKEVGNYVSFIGSVVIRRSVWLSRQREPYYGSLFIHVGVIFQAPSIASVRIVREPLVVIRYGNAMWTPRTFEIWMFKWPALVWSFHHLAESSRRSVSAATPYRSIKKLLWNRSIGGYAKMEYDKFFRGHLGWSTRLLPFLVTCVPARLANATCGIYCWLRFLKPPRMAIYDLARSNSATPLARALARRLRIQ